MEQTKIVVDQSFVLFCCAERYSVIFPDYLLESSSSYYLRYTFPGGKMRDREAELSSGDVLTTSSPGFDHPCTAEVSVYSGGNDDSIATFSLNLVSPVEYLFRKFTMDDSEMADKISDKMTSALLAMSLSYYYVMGEQVGKEKRMDEILSTLLGWTDGKTYMNTTRITKDISPEDSITQFAEHHQLQSTLKHLSGGSSIGDLPVELPKPLFPPAKMPINKKPAIIPRAKFNSLPSDCSNLYQVPNNRPLSEYSMLNPIIKQEDDEYTSTDQTDDHSRSSRPQSEYSMLTTVSSPDEDEEYTMMEPIDDDSEKLNTHMDHNKLTVTQSYPDGGTPNKLTVHRPLSLTNLTESADDVYELCGDNALPPVLPKQPQQQQRGRPPKPPTPYRVSHTMERKVPTGTIGIYQRRKVNTESTSSMESWKETSTSPPPQSVSAVKQEVYTTNAPHSDPVTRKNKQKLLTKLRNKLPSAT